MESNLKTCYQNIRILRSLPLCYADWMVIAVSSTASVDSVAIESTAEKSTEYTQHTSISSLHPNRFITQK